MKIYSRYTDSVSYTQSWDEREMMWTNCYPHSKPPKCEMRIIQPIQAKNLT